VPDGTDDRLEALAQRLSTRGDGSARARVDATVAWLRDCCTYALDVGAFATDQPVAEFVFDKQRGYCEYFASAAAVLLRLQGVPTRYVTGLSVTPANRTGDHFTVRASDAHAWIEVWIDGEGWIEVDPTPPDQYAALRARLGPGPLQRAWEAVSGFAIEATARFSTDWRAGLAWLLGLGAAFLQGLLDRFGLVLVPAAAGLAAWVAWRNRSLVPRRGTRPSETPTGASPASVDPALARLVASLERRWAAVGHPRPPSRGHLEHLGRAGEGEAGLPSDLAAVSREVVACYYRARYGGRAPHPGEIARLQGRLEA
jgi:hypothetical protein